MDEKEDLRQKVEQIDEGMDLIDAVEILGPKALLEWCTPEKIIYGAKMRRYTIYSNCGISDEEDAWGKEEYHEAQYGPNVNYLTLRSTGMGKWGVELEIEKRRSVLKWYLEQAKTNDSMREMAIQYNEQINEFLKTHKPEYAAGDGKLEKLIKELTINK